MSRSSGLNIRALIDYGSNEQSDGLQAILDENSKHQLVAGWRLKFFSIKGVLTSHNEHFKKKG